MDVGAPSGLSEGQGTSDFLPGKPPPPLATALGALPSRRLASVSRRLSRINSALPVKTLRGLKFEAWTFGGTSLKRRPFSPDAPTTLVEPAPRSPRASPAEHRPAGRERSRDPRGNAIDQLPQSHLLGAPIAQRDFALQHAELPATEVFTGSADFSLLMLDGRRSWPT